MKTLERIMVERIRAILMGPDDPDSWAAVMEDCKEQDLPLLVRIKSAIIEAINKILGESDE